MKIDSVTSYAFGFDAISNLFVAVTPHPVIMLNDSYPPYRTSAAPCVTPNPRIAPFATDRGPMRQDGSDAVVAAAVTAAWIDFTLVRAIVDPSSAFKADRSMDRVFAAVTAVVITVAALHWKDVVPNEIVTFWFGNGLPGKNPADTPAPFDPVTPNRSRH